MNIYSIYKVTNKINGKIYIGFDSNWPNRKHCHKKRSTEQKYNKVKFYNALRKYGWDNFEWEVIYQSLDSTHCKDVMENYFILQYRTYIGFNDCNGYNMTLGGEGSIGVIVSDVTRQKLSKANTGHIVSEETKRKIGLKNKGRKISNLDYSFKCLCCHNQFIDKRYSKSRKYCSSKCASTQRELNKKLKNIINNQESLGEPFTKILNDNLWDLYES